MLPRTACYLTDKEGNILNPFSPGSIKYVIQNATKQSIRAKTNICLPSSHCQKILIVCIQGYITLFEDGIKSSSPVLFSICGEIRLSVPEAASVFFETKGFHCNVIPTDYNNRHTAENPKIHVSVSTCALSISRSLFMLPAAQLCSNESNPTLFYADKVLDSCCFHGDTIASFNRLLKAETSYYIALSSGDKKEYTDEDSLSEYHGSRIPAPETVSYYDLFVNGMVQPKATYTIRKGRLIFRTLDTPPKGVFIVLEFVTYKAPNGDLLPAEVDYYVTQAKGDKRSFANEDALPCYSSNGIPSPGSASYFNLYINGVLQPKTNYMIRSGQLELISEDLPREGTFIVLESIFLKSPGCNILHAELEQYNALSNGGKKYTDYDELKNYSNCGIPAPQNTSYQRLLINSVLQPPINYSVQEGIICLHTEDVPLENAPLTLQSVSFLMP